MKKLLLFVLFSSFSLLMGEKSFAQSEHSEHYKPRSFDKAKTEKLSDSRDFKYGKPKRIDNYQESIIFWLERKIAELFRKVPYKYWDWFSYGLIAFFIIIVAYYLRKMTLTGPVSLQRSGSSVMQADVIDENIHVIDFDSAIREAIAGGQLRLAVRLYFLKTLKTLDEKKLIAHSREKTNQEYLRELKSNPLKDDFKTLARAFEFVWYGQMTPAQPVFEQLENRFHLFFKNLHSQNP